MCWSIFSLVATMNEINCYHLGICSVLSNYSFYSSLCRPGIDLREAGGQGGEEGGQGGEEGQGNLIT